MREREVLIERGQIGFLPFELFPLGKRERESEGEREIEREREKLSKKSQTERVRDILARGLLTLRKNKSISEKK